jgi:hypothetical protein
MTKSKITKFEPKKPFQGVTSAFVTFEDDNWGFFEYKGEAQFAEGDEVEYTARKEKTKSGKEIVKLTMEKAKQEVKETTFPPEAKQYFRNEIKNHRLEVPFHSMRLVMDAFIEGKIAWEKLPECFAEMNGLLLRAIDECGKENTGDKEDEGK